MAYFPLVVYDEALKKHRPLVKGEEYVNPEYLPISKYPGNLLKTYADGIYCGMYTMYPTLKVDNVAGVDVPLPSDGSAVVVKTLDHALQLIQDNKPLNITLLLKAGQTHTMSKVYTFEGMDITIGYYGDPVYGDLDSYVSGNNIVSTLAETLQRPILQAANVWQDANALWCCANIHFINCKVSAKGVYFQTSNVPDTVTEITPSIYSHYCDLFRLTNSEFHLTGSIVNKTKEEDIFGFLGLSSRQRSTVSQYCSQFRIKNQLIKEPVINQATLDSRQYFIKFLPDVPTTNTKQVPWSLTATSLGSVGGSGILALHWLLCSDIPMIGTQDTTLESWPLVDINYGVRNYIYGVRRDQQHRPLNIEASLLI